MPILKKIFATGLLASLSSMALAAPETYTVDSAHTFERFSYNHLGFSTQLSRFDRTTGSIVLDRAARTASVDIQIDTTSVDTGNALFNEHIQGADFLDTAHYPQATFKSTRVHFKNGQPTRIDGQLTLKGITRPVTLTLTHFHEARHPMQDKPAIGADATAIIRRSDFGAGKYAPAVSDEVSLSIALEAVKN